MFKILSVLALALGLVVPASDMTGSGSEAAASQHQTAEVSYNSKWIGYFQLAADDDQANACKARCYDIATECNVECPMDMPAGAACHLSCEAQNRACMSGCDKPKKEGASQ